MTSPKLENDTFIKSPLFPSPTANSPNPTDYKYQLELWQNNYHFLLKRYKNMCAKFQEAKEQIKTLQNKNNSHTIISNNTPPVSLKRKILNMEDDFEIVHDLQLPLKKQKLEDKEQEMCREKVFEEEEEEKRRDELWKKYRKGKNKKEEDWIYKIKWCVEREGEKRMRLIERKFCASELSIVLFKANTSEVIVEKTGKRRKFPNMWKAMVKHLELLECQHLIKIIEKECFLEKINRCCCWVNVGFCVVFRDSCGKWKVFVGSTGVKQRLMEWFDVAVKRCKEYLVENRERLLLSSSTKKKEVVECKLDVCEQILCFLWCRYGEKLYNHSFVVPVCSEVARNYKVFMDFRDKLQQKFPRIVLF